MKTSTGFEFELDKSVLDNMELLDALSEVEENPLKISTVVKLLLGEKTKKKLYDHVRDKSGRVPAGPLASEIKEIFDLLSDDLKK